MAKKIGKKGGAKVSKKGAKGAKRETSAPAGTIPLKKICQELGVDPKASRVKLRRVWRREDSPGVQFHSKGARWDLTPAQAKEVRAILAPAN